MLSLPRLPLILASAALSAFGFFVASLVVPVVLRVVVPAVVEVVVPK